VDPTVRWAVFVLSSTLATAGAFAVVRRAVNPLHSLANLLEGLREGDYSQRARNADPRDALGEVMFEVNLLSRVLHEQRFEAIESGLLLEKVSDAIDIAVFAFDASERLRLVNRAGAAARAHRRDRFARLSG
jgi:nitrogen fixation/metabolism regulation signal transduction histidine kinase